MNPEAHAPADPGLPLPLIPELPNPLIPDAVRMRGLEERLSLYKVDAQLSTDEKGSVLASQTVIEKKVEAALVTDGMNSERILAKRGQIRGVLFYPKGKLLSPKTYQEHVRRPRRYSVLYPI